LTKERTKELKRASWIGIAGNSVLSLLKITVGFISGSYAVVADGIDSLSDVFTFFITLYTTRIISKPPDKRYPYGYMKAETVATKLLSFIIFFAGAQLLISTASRIFNHEPREMPDIIAIYVTVISIAGKLILSLWQFKIGRKNNSAMIIANAKNMRNDIVISLSVLVGLIFTFQFGMPVLDLITALLVSFWIMKVAFNIFMETNRELMDGVDDTSVYDKIFQAVDSVEGAKNPHRIRVRKAANLYLIALDIEVDKNITVSDAHEIGRRVEIKIKKEISNIYDILLHIEPEGNIEDDEQFGLSRNDFKK
jgi:cation diffusion facilitator family transporter